MWSDLFCVPLINVAGTLMVFKCLTHAHTISNWPSPQLERRQRRHSQPFGRQLLGRREQWGLWNTPEGNPGQSSSVASTALACSQRVPMKKERRGGGEETPRSPYGSPIMSWSRCVLEKNFQTWGRMRGKVKLIRVGDAVRTAGQLKEEPKLNGGP